MTLPFFAIWNMTAGQFEDIENAFIGINLAISLMVFIMWTVLNGFMLTLNTRRYAIIAGTDFETFASELEAHRKAEDEVKRGVLRLQKFWPLVFIITVFFGLTPGCLLLAELLYVIGGVELEIIEKAWQWIK
ncbi:hypothetical protein ACEWPL_018320 [Roseovarius sp. S1116L3]|uniref:hypothetical protein n=1 Tax=Roseovarius roseus TaxID=3342636 RepID=UPI00372ADABC